MRRDSRPECRIERSILKINIGERNNRVHRKSLATAQCNAISLALALSHYNHDECGMAVDHQCTERNRSYATAALCTYARQVSRPSSAASFSRSLLTLDETTTEKLVSSVVVDLHSIFAFTYAKLGRAIKLRIYLDVNRSMISNALTRLISMTWSAHI